MLKIRGMLSLAVAMAFAFLLAGPAPAFAQGNCATPTIWQLTAGQTINVGTVEVCNDAVNLYVTYKLTYAGATFGTLQMWAGSDFALLPRSGGGNPNPGGFCQVNPNFCYTPAEGEAMVTHTFTIPFTEINFPDVNNPCGTPLFVATHAEVTMDSNGDGEMDHETAFGGDRPGDTGNRWWFYGVYAIDCSTPPSELGCSETAFGKGGWVFTTDKKSNPEKLPSLNLIRNRWGWAINLTAPGTYNYKIWAGAGLNNTANGTEVGTLTVDWNGSLADVSYALNTPYLLEEVHVYAGDFKPSTTAPGQYGFGIGFDPGVPTYPVPQFELQDTNGDGVWLIAHAVVGGFACVQ